MRRSVSHVLRFCEPKSQYVNSDSFSYIGDPHEMHRSFPAYQFDRERTMNRTKLNDRLLKSSLRVLLVILVGGAFFLLEFGASSRQTNQQQRTVDEKYAYPDCPVKIVEVETSSRKVVLGKPFADNDDWMKGLRVRVENVSGKVVTHVGIKITLERPESQHDQAAADWDLWYGFNPLALKSEQSFPATQVRPIQPGEIESIALSPQDYDALVSFLKDINFASSTQNIHVSVYTIGFADGTAWAGQLYRRDPKAPRGCVPGLLAIRRAERPNPRPTSRKTLPYVHRISAVSCINSRSHACIAWPPSIASVTSPLVVSNNWISGCSG
jgi:hypothetical protein